MRYIDADALKETLKDLEAQGKDKKFVKGVQDAIDYFFPQIIDDEPTVDVDSVDSWVSVNDRLPEEFASVIAFVDGEPREANYCDGAFSGSNFWRNKDVKYWIPMPKPPMNEQDDNKGRSDFITKRFNDVK